MICWFKNKEKTDNILKRKLNPIRSCALRNKIALDFNIENFKKFKKKIVHLVLNKKFPNITDPWKTQAFQREFIFTGLTEVFLNYIKLSLLVSFIFSIPVIIYQIWMFVAPGLLNKEKKIILPFLFSVPIMFILGFLIVYYFSKYKVK